MADAAAPQSTHAEPTRETMFVNVGGAAGISRLVDVFYDRMDTLSEARGIRVMHPADLGPIKDVLKRYLGEWLGGPTLYSAERGHPRLRQRHLPFKIGVEERDAWLLCMRGALDETVEDATARRVVYEAMEKLADWMRNQPGNPHDAKVIIAGAEGSGG